MMYGFLRGVKEMNYFKTAIFIKIMNHSDSFMT